MLKREIESDDAAARDAKQEGLLNAQEFQQGIQILTLRIGSLDKAGGAKAAQIVANDLVVLCEGRELIVPKAFIGDKAVALSQRVTLTGDFIIQPGAIHLGETGLHLSCVVHHLPPLLFSSFVVPVVVIRKRFSLRCVVYH